MTHASVFSGIGGPEVAATMLGWENLFHCEINPFGKKVLDYWYPNAESYDDITKTDFTKWRGQVNVLTGGFPCQPFSYAGQRRGADDDRYLWPHMFRCIDEIRPDWVVAENVAGILTMVEQGTVSQVASAPTLFDTGDMVRGQFRLTETFTLERICTDLESHGYEVQPILIPACAVGAPHRRDRVFIVGKRIALSDTASLRRSGNDGDDRRERPSGDGGQHIPQSDTKGRLWSGIGEACDIWDVAHPDSHRGREVDEHMEPEQPNGAEPFGNGREWDASDTSSERLERRDQSGCGERGERLHLWRHFAGHDNEGSEEVCGARWSGFPTVSPVHRGNDGLPFPLDDLAISQGKWRTEALKAYGNAIVPQVMYEIFRAIEIAENEKA